MYLIFDTETTGLPQWSSPSDHPDQPHIVDIAWTLYGADGSEIERFDAIINPGPGVIIPDDTIALHGITTERAYDEGISPAEMWGRFTDVIARAEVLSAFNATFDIRMMRITAARLTGDKWENPLEKFCTMYGAAKHLKRKATNLTVTLRDLFGEDHPDAHRARPDCDAAARIFFHLKAMEPAL